MTQNVGGWDRKTRLIMGTGAVLAGVLAPLPRSWRMSLLALGATELITGSTQYCPMNAALGINTYRREWLRSLTNKAVRALT